MNKLFLICHFRPEICDSFSFIQKHFESKRVLKNWLHTIQGFPILIWAKIIRVTVLCFTLPLPFKLILFMLIFKQNLVAAKNCSTVALSTKNSKLKGWVLPSWERKRPCKKSSIHKICFFEFSASTETSWANEKSWWPPFLNFFVLMAELSACF